MTHPFIATEHIWNDGSQLIDAVIRAGLDADVPSCPEWKTRDLAFHIGAVWNSWAWIVSERATSRDEIRAGYSRPSQLDDDVLIDWVTASHVGVHSALTSTPPDTEVWTWTGANRDVDWVRRRMAHETAVHRWDAENVVGDPYDIPTAMAADGIDEWLQWFLPTGQNVELGGTVHLHCTDSASSVSEGSDATRDTSGEWVIRQSADRSFSVERVHAKGDAAVRGKAHDLLLWVWARDGGPVEILGDEAVAQRLRRAGRSD
jgi:uncharacterized protein (TIGR03083 family)